MISLKDWIVEAFMNTRIYEMADDRKQFASKIDNALDQIIENLALIFYNIEHNKKQYIKHWLDELTTHIDSLRERKVKVSKQRIFYDVIDAVNITDNSQIKRRIKNKFLNEGFNLTKLSNQAYENIIYFVNHELSKICCKRYCTNNKYNETQQDIIVVLCSQYPDFEDYLKYSY